MRALAVALLALAVGFCMQPVAAGPEICYSDGGHLWLRDVEGGSATRITPDTLKGGVCRLPQWVSPQKIVFLYSIGGPDSAKTKVGIVNTTTKQVTWIPLLAGSAAIGYNKSANAIDFMKLTRRKPGFELMDVYLGEYSLATAKARSIKTYGSWNLPQRHAIFRWPEASMRLAPVGTSDVSDQIVVYSTVKKKLVTPKWLSDDWKQRVLGTWAVMSLCPGIDNKLAFATPGGDNMMGSNLRVVNTLDDTAKLIRSSADLVRNPSFTADGGWLAWHEHAFTRKAYSIWVCRLTSSLQPVRLCSGMDPAWNPFKQSSAQQAEPTADEPGNVVDELRKLLKL